MNKRIISKEEYAVCLSRGIRVGDCFVYMGNGNWVFATQEVKMVAVPFNKFGHCYFEPVTIFKTQYGIGSVGRGGREEDLTLSYNRSPEPSLTMGGVPDGRIVIHDDFSSNQKYNKVYNRLQTNQTYRSMIDSLATSTKIDKVSFSTDSTKLVRPSTSNQDEVAIHLGVTDLKTKTFYYPDGRVAYEVKNIETYYHPSPLLGKSQNEMGRVNTMLHEIVHVYFHLVGGREIPENHTGFNRLAVYNGMREYRDAYNLDYSDTELEFLSFRGLEKSNEFDIWISSRVLKKIKEGIQTTIAQEKSEFNNIISTLINKIDED